MKTAAGENRDADEKKNNCEHESSLSDVMFQLYPLCIYYNTITVYYS